MTEHSNTRNAVAESSRLLPAVMNGIAGLLLLGACAVQFLAPEGATVEVPTRRYGRRQTEVGLWVLYAPFVLAVLTGWYATVRLPRARRGGRRIWWILLLATGPAVFFAFLAHDALT